MAITVEETVIKCCDDCDSELRELLLSSGYYEKDGVWLRRGDGMQRLSYVICDGKINVKAWTQCEKPDKASESKAERQLHNIIEMMRVLLMH